MRAIVSVVAALFLVAIYMIFFYAPTEAIMGIVQKIFYFHLPLAFSAFLSFFVAFVCGILYLVKKNSKWDIYGAASVEIGVVMTTLVLISGSLWARPIWNTWWTWDPRLTTALILWLIYVAYLILRMSIEQDSKRASFCAVMAIIGFIDVPIVFFSARLWRTIHPVVIEKDRINLATPMKWTLLISMIAFFALWFVLFKLRTKTLFMGERVKVLNNKITEGA
jgi:heme exporter protein C